MGFVDTIVGAVWAFAINRNVVAIMRRFYNRTSPRSDDINVPSDYLIRTPLDSLALRKAKKADRIKTCAMCLDYVQVRKVLAGLVK